MDDFADREFVVPNGMPLSVFENKYARKKEDGTFQSWAERITEVIDGNFSLDPKWLFKLPVGDRDYERTLQLAKAGVFATSGRHLQHGDSLQADRCLEMHTNCATALFSFMLFRSLLRGAGVGRDYSTAICRVDWSNMPDVRLVLDDAHPDFTYDQFEGFLEPLRNAQHKYDSESERVRWFEVADTREGWAKVVEILETAAWQERHKDKLFIFDFSNVRAKGAPIMGLQGRPASGPIPLMHAIARVASIKSADMKPWKQALFIDHYLATCVHLGGARRSARMATKWWKDRDILEFIDIKRGGHLQSANNSILVTDEFWREARVQRHSHGRRVFEAAVNAAYWDKTGDPGFISVDQLNADLSGIETIQGSTYINAETYPDLHKRTRDMMSNVLDHVKSLPYQFIVNPCGEIVLSLWGGYCVIGDICLANVQSLDEAMDAVGLMSQFLIRCNLMKSDYEAEVKRTNRIGTSLTGIHEFAWNMFGLTFYDMIDYPLNGFNRTGRHKHKAHSFWRIIADMRNYAEQTAERFALSLGMVVPHTVTCIKPSGTVSKPLACTEGAHLPPYAHFIRWVQYQMDAPELEDLQVRGYPVKDVSHRYPHQVVVGFPTKHPLAALMGDQMVCANDVTPEENYRWLKLLEEHWLGAPETNNQISYTLKYDAKQISYHDFMEMILKWQPQIRCCAVMPQSDWQVTEKLYGYVPEQPIEVIEYEHLMRNINPIRKEAYDDASLACEAGACPIEPDR